MQHKQFSRLETLLIEAIEELVKQADEAGINLDDIRKAVPELVSDEQIRTALDRLGGNNRITLEPTIDKGYIRIAVRLKGGPPLAGIVRTDPPRPS